ncbi:transcriptional regulator domain-containing protein [Chelativorans xinjiangense]|uniref:transcriptional regulator domain-containing protein n=1 Tax=Chelativorans xinjiangense TaxID=2681485 RepID=UPI00135A1310|nr:DUF6499 domain-containing protein [Chelativorans xinjiangense]
MSVTKVAAAWPDWQDRGAYDYTERLTRRGWAWEFLRRNPDFQKDLARGLSRAAWLETESGVVVIRLAPSDVDLSQWGLLFCRLDRA